MSAEYVLATGSAAGRRLNALHDAYSPAGRRVLLQAGLMPGMKVADFGCGVGMVTRMLAGMVGPTGHVTGVDINAAQVEEAAAYCAREGLSNTAFFAASACDTGLPRNSFDLVYCRFLLLHLSDPMDCLREMKEILKPGGILVVEDGDLNSVSSLPPSATDRFSELFTKLGKARGLNYSLANGLYHMVAEAGFAEVHMEIHQPALIRGVNRLLPKWTIEEAGPALIQEGILDAAELKETLDAMQAAADDPSILILAVKMSLAWARKPLG